MTMIEEIQALKKEKDAVILAHYYVNPEVQAIADYIGDSFYLSKLATTLKEQTIIYCGVSFMGESAKILNPEKKVCMPDCSADCAMAHMAQVQLIQQVRRDYDDVAVVCYINSTAALKQYCDVCVTSSNAVKIVKKLPNKNIFFTPDTNLGAYVASQVPEKNFIYNPGFCPIHNFVKEDEVLDLIKEHPEADVLAHPECPAQILRHANYIGSTAGILDYATKSEKTSFIILTEKGIEYKLRQNNPAKEFYFTKTEPICKDMKTITLEKILHVLKTGENEVFVDAEVSEKSKKPLALMLELGK